MQGWFWVCAEVWTSRELNVKKKPNPVAVELRQLIRRAKELFITLSLDIKTPLRCLLRLWMESELAEAGRKTREWSLHPKSVWFGHYIRTYGCGGCWMAPDQQNNSVYLHPTEVLMWAECFCGILLFTVLSSMSNKLISFQWKIFSFTPSIL